MTPQQTLFPQAEQIINTDRFYTGSLRLLVLVSVFVAAGLWLFFGNLTFYETSSHIQTTRDNLIRATFTNEEVEKIAVEQIATLLFINDTEEAQTTTALIVRITPNVDDEHAQLDLLVTEREAFILIFAEDAIVQSVSVESAQQSPMRFLLESAGLTE